RGAFRQGPPRQALLSARAQGQGRATEGSRTAVVQYPVASTQYPVQFFTLSTGYCHAELLLLLRASSSAKMLSRFRVQVRLQIDFECRRHFCLRRQVAPVEKTSLHS